MLGRWECERSRTLPLRPWASTQPFLSIFRDTPMRLALTTSSLMLSRPCFFMSVFLLLAVTTQRDAGARELHRWQVSQAQWPGTVQRHVASVYRILRCAAVPSI